MIDNSHFCIVYYDEQNTPANRKSGTKIALDYAIKKESIFFYCLFHFTKHPLQKSNAFAGGCLSGAVTIRHFIGNAL